MAVNLDADGHCPTCKKRRGGDVLIVYKDAHRIGHSLEPGTHVRLDMPRSLRLVDTPQEHHWWKVTVIEGKFKNKGRAVSCDDLEEDAPSEEEIEAVRRSMLQTLDRVVAETEASLPEDREFEVLKKDEEWLTKCPFCGAQDEIYEVDKAVRWNSLSINEDGKVYAYTGDYEFESDGWVCGNCQAENIHPPDGFEIADYS